MTDSQRATWTVLAILAMFQYFLNTFWILFKHFLNTFWILFEYFWILFEYFSGCAIALRRDFEYWGLDELLIEPCCALKYYPALEVKDKENIRWLNPEKLRPRSFFWQDKKLYIKSGVSFPNWGSETKMNKIEIDFILISYKYLPNNRFILNWISYFKSQVCHSQIEGDKDEQDRDEQEMKEREIFGSSSLSKLRQKNCLIFVFLL